MQVVILAGGLGTRMQAVTGGRPKSLIPINGVPFISFQFQWLRANGVSDILLCVGHGAAEVRAEVTRHDGGLNIAYSDDGGTLLGTAGALRLASRRGLLHDHFCLLYGDSYLPIAIDPVWEHSGRGHSPTMTVMRNAGRWDRSNVIYADGRVKLYDKHVPDPAGLGMSYIDYGFLVLQSSLIDQRVRPDRFCDLADILTPMSRNGELLGYEVFERFYEIGSPNGLTDFTSYVTDNTSLSTLGKS